MTAKGETVIDPFGGACSTLIAAERSGRRAIIVEMDATYADIGIERWEKISGEKAKRIKPYKAYTGKKATRRKA